MRRQARSCLIWGVSKVNNRRIQRIRTWLKNDMIKFLKMSDEEQKEKLKKFWEKYNIHIGKANN